MEIASLRERRRKTLRFCGKSCAATALNAAVERALVAPRLVTDW